MNDPFGGNFIATIDDGTMTWTSTPPGRKIDKPIMMPFSRGGPVGSHRTFTIMPDGTVR